MIINKWTQQSIIPPSKKKQKRSSFQQNKAPEAQTSLFFSRIVSPERSWAKIYNTPESCVSCVLCHMTDLWPQCAHRPQTSGNSVRMREKVLAVEVQGAPTQTRRCNERIIFLCSCGELYCL